MYIEILVCYDISSNKRRRKLVKELKDMGLQNIQESVFWGRVLPAEFRAIQKIFETILKKGEDKAFTLRSELSKEIKNNSFGYPDVTSFEEKDYEVF